MLGTFPARNESREKEREPKREARSDAEGLTETRRSPRQQATRRREKAKPIGRRRVPSREVGEKLEWSKAKRRPTPIGGAKQEPDRGWSLEVQSSGQNGGAGSQFSTWKRDHPEANREGL